MKSTSIFFLIIFAFTSSAATARNVDPGVVAQIQQLSTKILKSRANSKRAINEESEVVQQKIKLLRGALDDALTTEIDEPSAKKPKGKANVATAKADGSKKQMRIAKIEAKLEQIDQLERSEEKRKSKRLKRKNHIETKIDALVLKLKAVKDKMKRDGSLDNASLVSLKAELTPKVYQPKHLSSPTIEWIK